MIMTKILVTGASGFIGSHLSKRLEKDGHKLVLLDNFSRGKKSYLDYLKVKTKCEDCDLRDPVEEVMFEGVDIVFHCASRIGGNQFLHSNSEQELKTLQDNLAIDNTVFSSCRKYQIKRVIYTSSVSVYNTRRQYDSEARFSETDLKLYPLDPEGGYGWAKYIGEKQLELLSKMGIKTGIARIFKSYGPCDDYSDKSGQVVCSLLRKAINYPREHFVVWGNGSAERCLVYIDDLIEGLVRLSNHDSSLTVNLGGNESYNMRYLATKIAHMFGKNIQIEHDMSKPTGVKSRIPDLTLAKEELNWEPTTTLDVGLKKTYEWMKHDLARN